MNYKYKKNNKDFSIEIKANATTEEQKKLLESLGNVLTSNMHLLNTRLLNTCINLLNGYSKELLSNICDYASISQLELSQEVQEIVDKHTDCIGNFTYDGNK